MTLEQAQTRAIMSILDVVEEIAAEVSCDPKWLEVVRQSFKEHRAELRDPAGHDVDAGRCTVERG